MFSAPHPLAAHGWPEQRHTRFLSRRVGQAVRVGGGAFFHDTNVNQKADTGNPPLVDVDTYSMRQIFTNIKQRLCSHRFAIEDLTMVNRDSDGDDRVRWNCDKCGKVFCAQCGLDISPANGPIFRRGIDEKRKTA